MPTPERITLRTIFNELLLLANLEKGLGYTLKMLAIAPGRSIREYLYENRQRMTRPFTLLVLPATAATFLTQQFIPTGEALWEDVQNDIDVQQPPEQVATLLHWFTIATKQYMNLLYLSSLPGLALATWALFRNKDYNFAEHLVINSYVFSMQTIFYCLYVPFLASAPWLSILLAGILTLYTLFAYMKIFDEKILPGALKSIGAYLLAQAISTFLLLLVGLLLFAWLSI